jgi:hypothetical protein
MNLDPKKLSTEKMWELYNTLKAGLDTEEKFLVDEVISIMEKIDTVSFKHSLRIMFGENFPKDLPPIEYALMFTSGIKQTGLLDFAHMIRGLNGSAR